MNFIFEILSNSTYKTSHFLCFFSLTERFIMLASKLQKTNNYYITRHSSSDTDEQTTKNSTSTLLVSLHVHNRTAERGGRENACVRQTWQGYYLHVLSLSSLNINVFLVKFKANFFEIKFFVTLVTQGLPSSLLSRPVHYWAYVFAAIAIQNKTAFVGNF